MEELHRFLARARERVDEELDRLLPPEEEEPRTLHRAMRYSVFAGGKRLRPALVLAAAELHDGAWETALPAACAMEMVHTYSLIHDDLPAMDDDDLRRGRPSCHRAFDEATAILAGDALLTQAFLVLAAGPPAGLPAEQRARAAALLAAGAGTAGMIGGQMADLEAEGGPAEPAVVERIHLLKTGALITASLLIGATLAGAGEEELGRMRAYGRRLGLLFQITDDILDVTGDPALLGKSAGKDDRQQKATWPAAVGLEEARAAAARLAAEAREALAPCGPRAEILRQLADYLLQRRH